MSRIGAQFIPIPVEMIKSPAFRALNFHELRILLRLEIEHAAHAGKDNGKLPVTYKDFYEYGVRRSSIAPSIAVLVALGFVEVTYKGRAGNAEFRSPSTYRLTYLHNHDNPTNEWARIHDPAEAKRIANALRRREPAERKRPAPPPKLTKLRVVNGTRSQPNDL
jgi:hypothetical protein